MAEKTNLGKALNVYGTNAASTGRNVCLYTDTPSDTMQKWKYSEDSGIGARLHSTVNNNYVLDRSDGSVSGSANNNAHLCAVGSTSARDSALTFVNVSGNTYRIRLANRINNTWLFLTAANGNSSPASSITASNISSANGNVYWAEEAITGTVGYNKQCWTVEEVGGSSGGGEGGGDYTINGVKLPLADWQPGKYWTTDGKPTDLEGTNSLHYNGIQCAGFARYVYAQIWGDDEYGTEFGINRTLAGNSSDFSGIIKGSRINCDRADKGGNHSMVILDKTSSGITVYEANHDGHCQVSVRTISFSDFAGEYKNIKSSSHVPQ